MPFGSKIARLASLVAFAAALVAPDFAWAQKRYDPGASDTEIRIGSTMPYSGPASTYGTIGRVQTAYFNKVNDEGGINGRKIKFLSLDDGYSPPKTVEMVRRLVELDEVLLVFGSFGTATNAAVQRYQQAKKVPQLFVGSGASRWNDPAANPWSIGWQPNYRTEAAIFAEHILKNTPNAKIAVLYQNDDYGKDYVKGFKDALGKRAGMIVAEATYEVTDATVDSQIIQLKGSGADVLFNVSSGKFSALSIRKVFDLGWKPVHYLNGVSSTIGSVLVPAGLEKSVGIISSVYIKDANDAEWKTDPAIREWAEFMKKYYPEGDLNDSANVYAYAMAQSLVQVLRQCGDNLTRENVMKQAASLTNLALPVFIPGVRLNTSPKDFAPIESMQLKRFDGKSWVRFGDVIGK